MDQAEQKKCNRCGKEYPNTLDHFRPMYHHGQPARPSGICRECGNRQKNERYHAKREAGPSRETVSTIPKASPASKIPTEPTVSPVSTVPIASTASPIPTVSPASKEPEAVAMSIRLPVATYERLRLFAYQQRLSLNKAVAKLIEQGAGPTR